MHGLDVAIEGMKGARTFYLSLLLNPQIQSKKRDEDRRVKEMLRLGGC